MCILIISLQTLSNTKYLFILKITVLHSIQVGISSLVDSTENIFSNSVFEEYLDSFIENKNNAGIF